MLRPVKGRITLPHETAEIHITEIGKALNSGSRPVETGNRHSDLVTRITEDSPLLVQRLHGSAGDEFVVNVRCQEHQLVPLAEKLIRAAYEAQMNMYGPEEQKKLEKMFI